MGLRAANELNFQSIFLSNSLFITNIRKGRHHPPHLYISFSNAYGGGEKLISGRKENEIIYKGERALPEIWVLDKGQDALALVILAFF